MAITFHLCAYACVAKAMTNSCSTKARRETFSSERIDIENDFRMLLRLVIPYNITHSYTFKPYSDSLEARKSQGKNSTTREACSHSRKVFFYDKTIHKVCVKVKDLSVGVWCVRDE